MTASLKIKHDFRLLIALLIALGMFPALNVKAESAGVIGSTTTTLYSIADSHVDQSTPYTNYGNDTRLMIQFNSQFCFTYIMFDLSSIDSKATLLHAELSVYAGSGSWSGPWGSVWVGAHYSSDNTWRENELTWNNMPSFEENSTDERGFGMVASEGYTSWDVTKDLKAAFSSGRLTEVLKFDSGEHGRLGFSSREARDKPMLIVEYTTEPIFNIRVESVQDAGNASSLGHIMISQKVFSLPNTVYGVPGSYSASYEGGFKFVRWETDGGVTVTDPAGQNATVTLWGNGLLRAVGSAETVNYAYDDGSYESSTSEGTGELVAVRFAPLFEGELQRASFYISRVSSNESENIVKVRVLGENKQDIIAPFSLAVSKGWVPVDLSSYHIKIDSEFYVGLEFTANRCPDVGVDKSVGSDRNVRWDGTTWFSQSDYNGYMIRAEVESSLPLTPILGPASEPILPVVYAAVAATAIVIVAVLVFALRRRSATKQQQKLVRLANINGKALWTFVLSNCDVRLTFWLDS